VSQEERPHGDGQGSNAWGADALGGDWPPKGGGDELLAQTSTIVMPSAFSPLQ